VLLPGTIFEEAVDIERIKPTMRNDRVFKVWYCDKLHILIIEFESGSDAYMAARLHVYSAILYHEYGLPIIPLIVYPFRCAIATSPLVITCGDDILDTFHFKTLPLFTLQAERYVQEHLTCMYPLLPAMQGANAELIESAMKELASLYREDEVSLAQQFIWMELLLERTDTISSLEKVKIQEKIKMYDPLWDDHPKVKKIREESEVKTLRKDIMRVVGAHFPNLTELAQQEVGKINTPDVLEHLMDQLLGAPDETIARYILHPSAA